MNKQPTPAQIRIGEGWDTHVLVAGRPLVLGGVEVPHTHGLLGHSDARTTDLDNRPRPGHQPPPREGRQPGCRYQRMIANEDERRPTAA